MANRQYYGGALKLGTVLWSPPRFERVVKGAFDQIRQAGRENPVVLIRLLRTLTRLAVRVTPAGWGGV